MTNRVMILGGGTEYDSEGQVYLHQNSVVRADRFLAYFYDRDNRKPFKSKEAFVLCSGGYGLIAAGIAKPGTDETEAFLMARYLENVGNVDRKLIRTEDRSTSTLTNLTYAVKQNSVGKRLINPDDFNVENPLGLVSHPEHLRRAALIANKLSLPKPHLEMIPTEEQDSRMKEFVLRGMYRTWLLNAEGTDELESREQKLERFLEKARSFKG